MTDSIQELIDRNAAKLLGALEATCELMLTSEREVGILIVYGSDGSWRVTLDENVEPMAITERHETELIHTIA